MMGTGKEKGIGDVDGDEGGVVRGLGPGPGSYLPEGSRCEGSSVREPGASSAGRFLAETTLYHTE